MAYRLSKRVISQFIRACCRRRLHLDLLAGTADRKSEVAPPKDAGRPGLALLAEEGRQYEREKFLEIETIFPDLPVRGELRPFTQEEDRVFNPIRLKDHIADLAPNAFALEVEYEVGSSFQQANGVDRISESLVKSRNSPLTSADVRPDIIWVRPPDGKKRRIITTAGEIVTINAPGKHEGSQIAELEMDDRRNKVIERDLNRYFQALEGDLETMPPEVVCNRVARFLKVDLPEVLTPPSWREVPLHIDHRCQGCDYLGYKWSKGQSPVPEEPDERYCWPTAEQQKHLSRIRGLTEGACGKLGTVGVKNIQALSTLSPGSTVFETHQALRASRTVLHRRVAVLEAAAAAEIPDRAGTSAVLPKWTDIRVAISADYDIGSGLTFAFGYHIVYFVQERQPDGTLKTNPRSFVRPFSSRRNRSRPRQTFSATGSDISSKKLCGRSKTSPPPCSCRDGPAPAPPSSSFCGTSSHLNISAG